MHVTFLSLQVIMQFTTSSFTELHPAYNTHLDLRQQLLIFPISDCFYNFHYTLTPPFPHRPLPLSLLLLNSCSSMASPLPPFLPTSTPYVQNLKICISPLPLFTITLSPSSSGAWHSTFPNSDGSKESLISPLSWPL